MASPQKENGYTSIANELMEAFARTPSIGSEAIQVLILLLRRSYGFQRKDAEMSISFIEQGTGMKRANAVRAVKRLVSKRILVHVGSSMSINKNYDTWVVSKRIPQYPIRYPPSIQTDTKVVSKRIPNKERIKETPDRKKQTVSKDTEAKPRTYEDGTKIILLPKETMSQIDERDRSFPRKRVFGNEKVDWTLDRIEFLLGRKLTGQERWNRIYAQHLTNKYGMTKTKALIEFICVPESWWFDKLSQMSTLYKNADRLFQEMEKEPENKILVIS